MADDDKIGIATKLIDLIRDAVTKLGATMFLLIMVVAFCWYQAQAWRTDMKDAQSRYDKLLASCLPEKATPPAAAPAAPAPKPAVAPATAPR